MASAEYSVALKNFIKKEPVMVILLIFLIVLTLLYPKNISEYPKFIDWRTITALAGLIVVTTGVKESKLLQKISIKLVSNATSQRRLAILLISISALLSTILTNDVTLLIIVPLTLSIADFLQNTDVGKLIIFETIAVNVGSALTPIGNPQNLFLWHRWGISFIDFCIKMFPLVFIMFFILAILTIITFTTHYTKHAKIEDCVIINKKLAIISTILTIMYITALELKLEYYALIVVIAIFIITYRNVLVKSDWMLLIIFILMFIDVGNIARISVIKKVASLIHTPSSAFLISAFISQIMSNVPASMFVAHFSRNWRAISYGVNVGGNGTIVASLANIISLRFAGNKLFLDFHKYSIIYFSITLIITYFIFFTPLFKLNLL